MTTFPVTLYQQSEAKVPELSEAGCAYFHDRGIHKFHSTLLAAYAEYAAKMDSPKTCLGKSARKDKAVISRLLSSSNNMTIGTFSLLLGAMGKEMVYETRSVLEEGCSVPRVLYTELEDIDSYYSSHGLIEEADIKILSQSNHCES